MVYWVSGTEAIRDSLTDFELRDHDRLQRREGLRFCAGPAVDQDMAAVLDGQASTGSTRTGPPTFGPIGWILHQLLI
jgi:hypothetical protein